MTTFFSSLVVLNLGPQVEVVTILGEAARACVTPSCSPVQLWGHPSKRHSCGVAVPQTSLVPGAHKVLPVPTI